MPFARGYRCRSPEGTDALRQRVGNAACCSPVSLVEVRVFSAALGRPTDGAHHYHRGITQS